MGYAGALEEYLDKWGQNWNKRFGTKLPPDVGRQLTNLTLDTVYSGGLSAPASWFRNAFQYDLLAYPRMGPKFYAEAAGKSVTKSGIKEARDAGFLVDLGVPYGEELAKDISEQGCFLVMAHPSKYDWRIPKDFFEYLHGVEVWNSKFIYEGKFGASLKSFNFNKKFYVGQDVHKYKHL